jgi:hypothetical protein
MNNNNNNDNKGKDSRDNRKPAPPLLVPAHRVDHWGTMMGRSRGTEGAQQQEGEDEGQQQEWDENYNEDRGTTTEEKGPRDDDVSWAIGKFFFFSFILFLTNKLF